MVLPTVARAGRAGAVPARAGHLPVLHRPHRVQRPGRHLHQDPRRRRGVQGQPRTAPSSSACRTTSSCSPASAALLAPVHQHPRVDRVVRGASLRPRAWAWPSCSTARCRGRGLYRVLLIVPWAVPAFVAAFGWKFLFNPRFGLINQAPRHPRPGPASSGSTTAGRRCSPPSVTNVWLGVPFMMVAILGGLQSIPGDLYEAAEMDGATPWQRFRNVTLPGPAPGQLDRDPAGHHLDLQHVPDHLLRHRRRAGRPEPRSWSPAPSARPSRGIRNYSLAATYGVLILSILMVFAAVYRRTLKAQGEVF